MSADQTPNPPAPPSPNPPPPVDDRPALAAIRSAAHESSPIACQQGGRR